MLIVLAAIALVLVAIVPFARPPAAERAEAMSFSQSDAWLEGFSLRPYGPMARLASRHDRNFLKKARACGEIRHYRRTQRTLLREYLRNLAVDYRRLHAIAAARSEPAPALELSERQTEFILLMWSVETRLVVQRVIPWSVDLQPLLANVEMQAAETRQLAIRPHSRIV